MSTEQIQVIQSNDLVFQQDKALIDTQIATAKAYPRSVKLALDNAITIVTMDKDTASSCHYALPRGGKSISGPSVHLAKILAQSWGNLRVEAKVVDIGKTQITSQAVAFDLESNIAIKVEVKRSIMTKMGRMNDDMITVTGNAANAIALRNAVFSVIPKNVIDKIYKSAIETITGDLSDENKFIVTKKKLIETFYSIFKVEESEILGVLGKTSTNQITKDDYMTLYGLFNAIKDGDTTVEDTFRKKNNTPKEQDKRDEILDFINNEIKTLDALESVRTRLTTDEQKKAFEVKESELKKTESKKVDNKNNLLKFKELLKQTYPENTDFENAIQSLSELYNIDSIEELTEEQIQEQSEIIESVKKAKK
jgi:hypothetical protein